MAEIAGAEPAIAKSLGVGLGVIVVAGEHGGADDADLAGLERFEFAPLVVLNRDLHARALDPAGADARMRPVLRVVQRRRQPPDIARDLAQTGNMHPNLAVVFLRRLLV